MKKKYFFFCLMTLLNFFTPLCFADNNNIPKISIIIDDLGNNLSRNMWAVNLPGPIVCSILPQTYFSRYIANQAHAHHKEIILHIPMQALRPVPLGPGGLTENMPEKTFFITLDQDYLSIPYAEAVSNHMGSLLTQNATDMNWLMFFLKQHQLIFIDSRTIGDSIAEKIAEENGVPTAARSVFLDDVVSEPYVAQQFQELIADAKKYGAAIAIGHPNFVTLEYLQQEIPALASEGVELVPLSQIVAQRNEKEYQSYYQAAPQQEQNPSALMPQTNNNSLIQFANLPENLNPDPVAVAGAQYAYCFVALNFLSIPSPCS